MRKMEIIAEGAFFAFLAAVVMMAITLKWLYDESPPMLDLSVRIVSQTVRPGGDFVIRNKFNRPVTCASWWHRYIFDDHNVQVLGLSEYRPADATIEYTRAIRIPTIVQPGLYSYQATILWHCNWVQELAPKEVRLPAVRIEVIQ